MITDSRPFKILILILLYAFFVGNTLIFMFSPVYLNLVYRFQPRQSQILLPNLQEQAQQVLFSIYPFVDVDFTLLSVDLNSREIAHLKDVKNIFSRFLVAYFVVILFLKYIYSQYPASSYRQFWTNSLLSVCLLSISIFVSLLSMVTIVWNQLFTLFHQLLFTEGSWIFYENDLLITLFPEMFWLISAVVLIIMPALQAAFFFVFAAGYISFTFKTTNFK